MHKKNRNDSGSDPEGMSLKLTRIRAFSVITRRIATAATGIALVVPATIVAAGPALAAGGGGCRDTTQNGWSIGVCVSRDGAWAYPDIYVNRLGDRGSLCYITLRIFGPGGDPVAPTGTYYCDPGHHGPIRVGMSQAEYRYYAVAQVHVGDNRKVVFTGYSPTIWR